MNLYNRFILPRVVHFTCSRNPNMRQRAKVIPSAAGEVLEIDFGSGLNLPFYDGALVKRLWALDPAEEMWALDRDIPALLTAGGFRTLELETMYIPGWKPASFNSWGRAVPCGTP